MYVILKKFVNYLSIALCIALSGCGVHSGMMIGGGAAAAVIVSKIVLVSKQDKSTGSMIDDFLIRRRVRSALADYEGQNLNSNIDVDVQNGKVFLFGSVSNPSAKVDAELMTWSQKNVKKVINDIKISNNNSTEFKDISLKYLIIARLLMKGGINSSNYHVLVRNGDVEINGTSKTEKEKNLVLDTVRRTAKIRKVISYIQLSDDDL